MARRPTNMQDADRDHFIGEIEAARKNVAAAITNLGFAAQMAGDHTERNTVASFQIQLDEFLSADDGEAGLDAWITQLKAEVV